MQQHRPRLNIFSPQFNKLLTTNINMCVCVCGSVRGQPRACVGSHSGFLTILWRGPRRSQVGEESCPVSRAGCQPCFDREDQQDQPCGDSSGCVQVTKAWLLQASGRGLSGHPSESPRGSGLRWPGPGRSPHSYKPPGRAHHAQEANEPT